MKRISAWAAVCLLACAEAAPISAPIEPPIVPAADAGAPWTTEPPEPPPTPAPMPAPGPRPRPVVLRPDVPAISGGTMVATSDGLAIAGDELTDQLWVLDLAGWRLLGAIDLEPGAMPGRAVEDGDGFVHVITRRGGELVRVEPRALRVVDRRRVCGAPRGLAWDGALLHVACSGGELVSLAPEGGAPVRSVALDPDLRDVVALGDRLYVSRFRSAELLVLDASGSILSRSTPLGQTFPRIDPPITTEPRVAWRLVAHRGLLHMVHQQEVSSDLAAITVTGGGSTYYIPSADPGVSRPGRIVAPRLTTFDAEGQPVESGALQGALVVDLAMTSTGRVVARPDDRGTVGIVAPGDGSILTLVQDPNVLFVRGWPAGRLDPEILLRPQPLILNAGQQAFHRVTVAGVACASCHPEGHEDGHTWIAADTGARRTQSLLGGLRGTEPFHWNGDLDSFEHLMDAQAMRLLTAFTAYDQSRMLEWLDHQPSIASSEPATPDAAPAFERAGCASCHAGASLSDEQNHDVGAGSFQTPRLAGVLVRAPYFADGCAASLEQTLDGSCRAIEAHGISDPAERASVVDYLRSL